MPELPEVETLRLGLHKYLIGHNIKDISVRLKKIFYGSPKNIIRAKFVSIRRFGKGLVLDLDNGYSIAVHIKLTGQLIYQGPDIPKDSQVSKTKVGSVPNAFTHVIFYLDNNAFLYYNDVRQFGWIKIVPTDKVHDLPFFKDLGPEFPDLTIQQFSNILSKTKGPIKPLLMDQKRMSGIGNIYANESLYLSKILPMRPANSLSLEEIKKLYNKLANVLKKSLELGGASELTFINVLGQEGNYQKHFVIYGQQGKPCKKCGTIIKKVMLGGRGTNFCPHCQN